MRKDKDPPAAGTTSSEEEERPERYPTNGGPKDSGAGTWPSPNVHKDGTEEEKRPAQDLDNAPPSKTM